MENAGVGDPEKEPYLEQGGGSGTAAATPRVPLLVLLAWRRSW